MSDDDAESYRKHFKGLPVFQYFHHSLCFQPTCIMLLAPFYRTEMLTGQVIYSRSFGDKAEMWTQVFLSSLFGVTLLASGAIATLVPLPLQGWGQRLGCQLEQMGSCLI